MLIRHETIVVRHEQMLIRHETTVVRHEHMLIRHETTVVRHEHGQPRHECNIVRHDNSVCQHVRESGNTSSTYGRAETRQEGTGAKSMRMDDRAGSADTLPDNCEYDGPSLGA